MSNRAPRHLSSSITFIPQPLRGEPAPPATAALRRALQEEPDNLDIALHLLDQRFAALEPDLIAQPLHELHGDAVPVEVAVVVEKVRLQEPRAAVKRWAHTDIGCRRMRLSAGGHPGRVDAVRRDDGVRPGRQVGGREAQALAASFALFHDPGYCEPPAEHRSRGLNLARRERRPDGGAADNDALDSDRLDRRQLEAQLGAQRLERAGVPAAVAAHRRAGTHHQGAHIEGAPQDLNELARRQSADLFCEIDVDHRVHAGLLDEAQAL
ncbi:MAG: hypothetical protein V3S18_03170 [Dehalococcoidia bacterium]